MAAVSERATEPVGTPARACVRCLYVEGMALDFLPRVVPRRLVKHIVLDEDGVCSLCRAYERDFDREALDAERQELLAFARGAPVVLALSGGKDSLSTLWIARQSLGLDVRAVLLDNGFIPPEVVEVARAACARVETPLVIARLAEPERAAFASIVAGDTADQQLPCGVCSQHLERSLVEVARDASARVLLLGTNFFASWGKRPSAVTVSTARPLHTLVPPAPSPPSLEGELAILHLPYALGVTRRDVEHNLEALGVRPVAGLAGSTNCRVPGLLQARAAERGHTLDVEDLLLEVLVGHLSRDEAMAALRRR